MTDQYMSIPVSEFEHLHDVISTLQKDVNLLRRDYRRAEERQQDMYQEIETLKRDVAGKDADIRRLKLRLEDRYG